MDRIPAANKLRKLYRILINGCCCAHRYFREILLLLQNFWRIILLLMHYPVLLIWNCVLEQFTEHISGSCLHISGPETGQIGLYLLIEEEFIQKRRQRSSGRFGGQNLVNYLLRQDVWRIGWIHHFLNIILVQLVLFLISSWCKTASGAMTFVFSSV